MSLVLPFNFLWFCDGHRPRNGPADAAWTLFGTDEYRRYSSWLARILAALTKADTLNTGGLPISFFLENGDFIELLGDDDTQNLIEGVAAVSGGDWAGPYLDVIGNHEQDAFTGNWAANYFANLLGRTAADHQWTDNDDESDGVAGKAYSVDIDGFHIVVLYAQRSTHTVSAGQLAWLAADLAHADHQIPTIVFQHAWISDVWPRPATTDYANIANASAVRAVLEVDGNTQADFGAHFHMAHAPVLINDIWYFSGLGSVDAPGATDNAYYLVQIIPNAYGGTSRNRANIKLTRYGSNSKYGLKSTHKDYDRFLIGST